MRRQDYFRQGVRGWLRLHEKGGKRHDVPAHHRAEEAVEEYVAAAGLEGARAPLFQSLDRTGRLSGRPLGRRAVLAMIKRRAVAAGLPATTCCHTFRATGITAYLVERGKARARPADRGARVAEDDEAVRPDGGRGLARRDRAPRDLRPAGRRASPSRSARRLSRSRRASTGTRQLMPSISRPWPSSVVTSKPSRRRSAADRSTASFSGFGSVRCGRTCCCRRPAPPGAPGRPTPTRPGRAPRCEGHRSSSHATATRNSYSRAKPQSSKDAASPEPWPLGRCSRRRREGSLDRRQSPRPPRRTDPPRVSPAGSAPGGR